MSWVVDCVGWQQRRCLVIWNVESENEVTSLIHGMEAVCNDKNQFETSCFELLEQYILKEN